MPGLHSPTSITDLSKLFILNSLKLKLEISGLWKKDYLNGQEGFTLAAALLLGKDDVIQQIIPHHKIDGLIRINHTDRYDDRAYIQCNLIEEYVLLMDFVSRHLPVKFYH